MDYLLWIKDKKVKIFDQNFKKKKLEWNFKKMTKKK